MLLLLGCDSIAALQENNATSVNLPPVYEMPDYIIIDGEQFSTELTELNLSHLHVTNQDIELLQYMINLERLSLSVWEGHDITPLASMKNLIRLHLVGTPRDITPLSELTSLEVLIWEFCQSDDLTPLSSLVNLNFLFLEINQVSNLSPLSSLINLERLDLLGHQIADVTPLSSLTNLTNLTLLSDKLVDITPLKYLTNLTEAYLFGHQIIDWSPVAHVERVYGRP